MRILAVFPLALGLVAAAAVSTAGAAASSAIASDNDAQFKEMSASERAQFIEDMEALGMVKREVGPAVSPTLTEETGEGDDEESLEEFVPEEQQEIEAEDGFRELTRRDVEDDEAEQADAGADETEAPAVDQDPLEDADAEGQDDEAADEDDQEDLDPTATENVQNAINDPEVQAYVSNGDWDDSNEADDELAVSPAAAVDADSDDGDDADDTSADTDETPTDGTTLSRRKEAVAKTPKKNNNIHLKVCPPCMKKKNPPLQCRIMSARRHWCKENKRVCKEKHTWLHRALFVNKPKTAKSSGNVGKPKHGAGNGKVQAQSYQPAKNANTPPSYGASTQAKHGKKHHGGKGKKHSGVTKKHRKHPKHRAGRGKHPKHPKHAHAPAHGAGANAGKFKGRPSLYVPIHQGGIPKYATQPAQAYATQPAGQAGKHKHGHAHAHAHAAGKGKHGHAHAGKHNAGHSKGRKHGSKGKGKTTTMPAGAGANSTAPAPRAPAYGGGSPRTSTVMVTPTSYLVAAKASATAPPSYGMSKRDLEGVEGEEGEGEGSDVSDGEEEEDLEEGGSGAEEGSETESDDDEEEEDDEVADDLAKRDIGDIAFKPHVSLRPKCMDTYAPHPPKWCKVITDRRQWCVANGLQCRAKHPWLYSALGKQGSKGKILPRDTEDADNGEDLDGSASESDDGGMSEEEHRYSDLELDADDFDE